MCFIEFLCLEFSLLFSYLTTYGIVHSASNNYLYFLLILFIPLYYIVDVLIYLIYVIITSSLINKKGNYNKYFCHLIKETDIILLHLLHVKIKLSGKELPKEKCLIVANHRSNFDPILFINIFSKEFVCISKKETFKFKFVGNLIRACGYISLDRDNNREAVKSLGLAADYLKNDIASVCIFPEGTRNKTEEPLLEMHAGSFKPAQKANKKIVVCSIKGSKDIKAKLSIKRQYVYINIIDILDPSEYSSTQEIKDKAYNLILEDITK